MRCRRCSLGFAAVLVCLFTFSGCGEKKTWEPGKAFDKASIKIGVIHPNEISEASFYDYAHYTGTVEMQKNLGLKDEQIIRRVNVFDQNPGEIEIAMRECIDNGAMIIIAASWGYMDTCEKLAKEFPNVIFAHATGYKYNSTNFTNYSGRAYEARYLSGIVAGLKTQSGKIGYVAARGQDNSEVTGGIDAFALGVERANPDAEIHVKVTQSWFDPMGETDAANYLIGLGCDVVAEHCNTAFPLIAAQKAGVWGIGFNSDMSSDAPDAALTSVLINWGVYYTALVQSVIDGSFTTRPYFGGLAEGMVGLAPLNQQIVPPEAADTLEKEQQRIMSGAFHIFEGSSDEEIVGNIHWYHHNVIEH
jgi:basic membrane protein A